ncbi:MAG: hypothetical protein CO042_00115 [Parcubacteria group bacterium CG_4_9_14_0_2_um_filter_41_8]|nr:MAG: hypothetical protein AUJ34_03360 [Parcubacteria group bacterium CG1_02_41_12]PIP66782.1 MAG: hypothetical protein COW93_03730 [Parcubacteria group bacterium CG22_combo_CG10-13_8_21_14_all_41_9]PIQ80501.1 MAG: hypothetical protein COV79_00085 [Parcubacteria group bacterium CG11_big_fil_rev_8_21_14_0_20_41_14]PIR57050.1 MAG: hypothetical protein COU72_02975 [Parcubacteria group bacterium CG10_big_fil_rev_8_21_14_0_10_41_35]PIZ78100.1 MAG: hypothetical protein COY02_04260 [Parcubacteria gr
MKHSTNFLSSSGKVLVISGPTGSGESTVTNEIIKQYPNFVRLTTATTRPKRLKEKDKVDYYFFTEDEFKREIECGNIIEYQNNRNGVYYGSYKPDLEKKFASEKIVIVNPDIVGTRFYKKHYHAPTIFIAPESIDDIRTRLLNREPNMDSEQLASRLAYAQQEIKEESPYYDYQVINRQNKLDQTIAKVIEILKKEGFIDKTE